MIRITGFFVIMILAAGTGWAQKITGYSTLYDDRFDKWILVTDDPNVEGGLEATWAVMQDWSEWQYTLGDRSGWIRLRNKNNLNIWEVVGDGQILEVRTIFPDEFDHWQVRYRNKTYDVRMPYRGDPEQWSLKSKKDHFYFYTYYEGDIRDWVVENETDFPLPLQIGLTFIPILQVLIH